MLVIDDLGSEESTNRAKTKIAEIISERCNQGRTTILIMNEDALELSKLYGQRMGAF